MTNTPRRYFGKCPVCGTKHVGEPVDVLAPSGGRRKDRLVFADPRKGYCYATRECDGWPIAWKGIKVVETATKCDARCIDAKDPLCKCSCGGENHGISNI